MSTVAPRQQVEPVILAIQAWVDHAVPVPDDFMAQAEADPSCLYWLGRRVGFWAATCVPRRSGPLGPLTYQRERVARADELAARICVAIDVALRSK